MSILKKFFAGVASLSIALTAVVTAVPAAGAYSFTDINDHWAEPYIADLTEKGIVTDNTRYYPNNPLTRAELTKLALEAFYGDALDDVLSIYADGNPSFSDVNADDWYYGYVEAARGLEIVKGFEDGTFKPNNTITRAETMKVIWEAAELPDALTPASPFTDVSMSQWYYDYVTSAHNYCVVNGTSPTTFTPNGNVTRGEAAKIVSNGLKVYEGEDLCGDTPPPPPPECEDENENGICDDEEVIGECDGSLEVSLSADTPTAQPIPYRANNIPFTVVDLTNTGGQDIEVTELVVAHGGLGYEEDIDSVKVYDGIYQRGSEADIISDGETATIRLERDPITVEAGTTKQIVIAADMDARTTSDTEYSGGSHYLSVLAAGDIAANCADGQSASVIGSFPVDGEPMHVSNVAVGSLKFIFKTVSDTTLDVGETDADLARMEIRAGSNEDVLVQAITLEFDGADAGMFGQLYLEHAGEAVSEIIDENDGEMVTFDLTGSEDGGWLIGAGDSKIFYVKADVLAGVDEDVTVQFDEVGSDVFAVGATFGFGVAIDEDTRACDNNACRISILGGDLTFAIDSTSRDVAPGTDNVDFGTLTITNYGEAIEIDKGLTFNLYNTKSYSTAECANDALQFYDDVDNVCVGKITDVRLVDTETGATFMGPDDPSSTGEILFGDKKVLETGEVLTLSIQGDVENGAENGDEFYFSLNMGSVEIEGIESGEKGVGGSVSAGGPYTIKPTSNPTTNNYKVAYPSVTFNKKALDDGTYVKDAKNALVWQGTIRANGVEDLLIRRMDFYNEGNADQSDIDSFSLYKKEGNTYTAIETLISPNASGDVSFTDLDEAGNNGLLVPAGAEFQLVLRANIAPTVTPDATIQMWLDVSNVDAEDYEGDTAEITNDAVNIDGMAEDISSGAIFTLQKNGSITITRDSASPDSALLAASRDEVFSPVAVFKFTAHDEDAHVEDLSVIINELGGTTGIYEGVVTTTGTITDSTSVATANSINVTFPFDYTANAADRPTTGNGFRLTIEDDNTGAGLGSFSEYIGLQYSGSTAPNFTQKFADEINNNAVLGTKNISAVANGTTLTVYYDDPHTTSKAIGYAQWSPDYTDNTGYTEFDDFIDAGELDSDQTVEIPPATDGCTARTDKTTAGTCTDTISNFDFSPATATFTVGGTATDEEVYSITVDGTTYSVVIGTDVASGASTAAIALALETKLNADYGNTAVSGSTITLTDDEGTYTAGETYTVSSNVAGVLDTTITANPLDDARAIDAISLYYYDDGTQIMKESDARAVVNTSGNNQVAFFQDLNLIVPEGEDLLVEVRVDLTDMDTTNTATARSGMAFDVQLAFDNAAAERSYDNDQTAGYKGTVRGYDSGTEYGYGDITIDNKSDNGTTTTLRTDPADAYYVVNNVVMATDAISQPSSLTANQENKLLNFQVEATDDADQPYLCQVDVSLGGTLTFGSSGDVTAINLYNDENERIATAVPDDSGDATLTAGNCDEIEGGSEVYTLEAQVGDIAKDQELSATIEINGSKPGVDGITWKDGGRDGTDGVYVQWIDLGEDDTTTSDLYNKIDN